MSIDDDEMAKLLQPVVHQADGEARRMRISKEAERRVAVRDVGDFFLSRLWVAIVELLRPLLKMSPASDKEKGENS